MTLYLAEPYDSDGDLFYFDTQADFYARAEENRDHGIKMHPNNYKITSDETGESVDWDNIHTD
jgi:tRNA A58 N-methylase Trm61